MNPPKETGSRHTQRHDHKPAGRRGAIRLEAGRRYDIKVEYFENGIGHAEVHLRWLSPSQPLEVVPESALWQAKS